MLTALINARIFTGYDVLNDKAILINNGRIEKIVGKNEVPDTSNVIDCQGNNISAGLIDLQIAGSGGYLFSIMPTKEALYAIAESILKSGTTGFLIVVPTNTFETYRKVVKILRSNTHPAVLGLHLEGPYINPVRRGAHLTGLIKKPDIDEIKKLIDEAEGVIKMVTIAPELCDEKFIKVLIDSGIVIAAGHSNATYDEAVEGFRRGIRTVTHLFNAMSPLHHRDPGLPGAVFRSEGAFASIIADGVHVHYAAVSFAKKIMQDRLFLVSDAVEGNMDGVYPNHIRQQDRFTLPDGTLSGSLLTMMTAVRNCVQNTGIPIDEALRMASAYPAKLMGLNDKGIIKQGNKADLVVFDDDFEVRSIIIEGEKVD
jgi:N-acetylglucosamine-6-phosphate deacetylase